MNTTKYHLENKEILNKLITKIFEVLERLIIKEQWERTYKNLSKSIPDTLKLDKQLILSTEAELNFKGAKQDLLDLMQVIIENEH